MPYEELKVRQKVKDMMKYGYEVLRQFPKSEKFALGADIKRCMDVMLERSVEAEFGYYKKTTFREFDVANKKLLNYLQIAHELGFLSPHKLEVWSEKLIEIGKMIGGLIKSAER